MKRTIQVNVKMSEEDFSLLRKAADKHWPDAVMTNSGIVLGLARIAAKENLCACVFSFGQMFREASFSKV